MTTAVLGVVGGSGVYDIEMDNARWETIDSPWGNPSDEVRRGEIGGTPVVFLPRHGRGHRISPTDINYRANIDILKRAGVTDNPPVHLIRFADGRVGLRDDATGWKISLVGFGQDNAAVWNALIAD